MLCLQFSDNGDVVLPSEIKNEWSKQLQAL
jgi:hypothetical protein